MPRESLTYRPMEAFDKPSDTAAALEPPPTRFYRHEIIRGDGTYTAITFNALTGIVHSPFLPEGQQEINLARNGNIKNGLGAEGKILEALMKNPTGVLSWNDLAKVVWENANLDELTQYETNILRVCIHHLRNNLGEKIDWEQGRYGKKIVHTIPRRGITLADSIQLIAESNPTVQVYTTPSGKILVNPEALLATSPAVNEGKTPVELSPTELDLLLAFAEQPEGRLGDTFKWNKPGTMRTNINYLRGRLGNPHFVRRISGGYQMTIEKAA